MVEIPQAQEFISDILNKYVVTAQNSNKGVSGFLFDILLHEEINLDSDITDHYVEDNYAIQDHIAQKPVMFTLKGLVGELINKPVVTGISALNDVQSLSSLGGIAPEFASQATQVYTKVAEEVANVNEYVNQANNIINIFDDKSSFDTKQHEAFATFYSLWETRTLCTIETPFGVFEDMAILRLGAVQRDETNLISDFSITFKKIRTTTTKTVSDPVFSGRSGDSFSSIVEKGQVVGQTTLNNLLSTAFKVGTEQ